MRRDGGYCLKIRQGYALFAQELGNQTNALDIAQVLSIFPMIALKIGK